MAYTVSQNIFYIVWEFKHRTVESSLVQCMYTPFREHDNADISGDRCCILASV